MSGIGDKLSGRNDSLPSYPAATQGIGETAVMYRGMELKAQLKHFLQLRGLTAAQLARMSGVPRQSLSDWMGGSRPRNLDHVKQVADALKISIDELCYGEVANNPPNGIDALLGDEWVSGLFEIRLRRIKKDKK